MFSLGYSVFLAITKISGTKEKPGTVFSNSNSIWTVRVNVGFAANVHRRWTAMYTIMYAISKYSVWCMVYGVWCMVYGVWCMVYGVWCMVYGVWCMVHVHVQQ